MSVLRRPIEFTIHNRSGIPCNIVLRSKDGGSIRMQGCDNAQGRVEPQAWTLTTVMTEFLSLMLYGPTHSKIEFHVDAHDKYSSTMYVDGEVGLHLSWEEPSISWKTAVEGEYTFTPGTENEVTLELRADMGQCFSTRQRRGPKQIESMALETSILPKVGEVAWAVVKEPKYILYYRKGIDMRELITKD